MWMTLEEAWREFYAGRDNEPTETEYEMVRDICADAGATRFAVRDDGEIIFSDGHTVHVNPGFIVTKVQTRHVVPDRTYETAGFTHRLKFSTFGRRSRTTKGE